jgi:uncharacterized membrane protein
MSTDNWTVEDTQLEQRLTAHLGLFQYTINLQNGAQFNDYSWCKGWSGAYSTGKCGAWRISQIAAIVSVIMCIVAVVLFALLSANVFRTAAHRTLKSTAWAFMTLSGITGNASRCYEYVQLLYVSP